MGCANSAKLTEEVQHLQSELDSMKKSLVVANELKEAFSQELEKRRQPDVSTNYRTEGPSIPVSDAPRDELAKLQDWLHSELSSGHDLFLRLLRLAGRDAVSLEAEEMRGLLERLEESNYDVDLLLDFSVRRARSLGVLAEKVADDRDQLRLHLRVVEEQLKSLLFSVAGQKATRELQDTLAGFTEEQTVEKMKAVSAFLRMAVEAQTTGDYNRLKKYDERFEELRRSDESKARELNAKNVQIRHLEAQLKEHSRSNFDARLKQLEAETRVKDLEIAHLREQVLQTADAFETKKMLETEVSQLRLALHISKASHSSGNQVEWLQSQLLETQMLLQSLEEELAIKCRALQAKEAKLAQNEARLRELTRQKAGIEEEVRAMEANGARVSRVTRMIKDLSGSIEKGLSN